jgi:hypothetical protein
MQKLSIPDRHKPELRFEPSPVYRRCQSFGAAVIVAYRASPHFQKLAVSTKR